MWIREAPMDLPWIIGCSRLREAIKKNDLTCFESVFDADIARLPDIVKNEQVGTGLHVVSAFGWVVRERGALLKSRAPASAENPMVQGLRALKSALVEYVKRCVAERWSAPANHPTGPSTTPLDDDGIETKTASQAGVDRLVYSGAHDTRTSGDVGGGGEADLVGGEERRAGSVEESSTDSESESGSEEEEDEEEEEERAGKKAVGADSDTDAGHGAGRDPTSTGRTGATAASAGDKPRRKAPVHGQPASTTSSKSAFAAALAHVKRLEEENRKLRDKNAGLRSDLVTERGRTEGLLATAAECLAAVKSLTERVAAADQTAGTHISTATAAMTGVFTKVLDDRVALVKACSSMATPLLGEITKGLDKLADARRDADVRLGNHVTSVGDNIKAVLVDYIQTKLASTSTNIVGGLSRSIAPPPPGPSPALPEEVIKAMRDDIVQAVTAVTQQALGTAGFTLLPNVVATMRLGRHGSSPSAGDLETTQRQRPEKRAGSGSAADGDNAGNSKRSKGVGGERAVGGDVPDRAQSGSPVLDMLRRKGATTRLLGPQSRGGAGSSSEGRTAADEGVRVGGSSTHGGGRKGPEIPRHGASEVAPPPSDRGNVAVESVEMQAGATIPTINTATGASTNAGLFPTGVDRGPPFKVEAPSIGDQTHQAPVVGVGGDTGALGVEDTCALGVEDDPVARALMEELLAFQAPSQHAIDNAAVPTTREGGIPLIIEDEDVELIQAAMEADEVAALQSVGGTSGISGMDGRPAGVTASTQAGQTVQPARLASTGVSVAGQAVPPIQNHPAGFIQVDRAFQTGPSGVTGSDQAGLAGQSTRPTAVTVATQAGQAGPSDRSAGVTVVDLAGQAGTSTVLAGGPVGEHADKDGQTDRAAGVGEKKKKRKGKASASQKAVVPKDRRGHGIRLDRTSGGGWQGEVNLAGKSRYTGRSDNRMEVAYLNGVATTIFDGHASQVLLAEMTGVKAEEMTRWKAEWEEAKVMPKGMWTVMWSHGATMFRARFQKVLADFKQKKSSGPPLMKVLRPAVWFGTGWEPAKRKQQLSDVINRACLCAAFGPVTADAVPKTGADAKRIGQAVAASSCAVWSFAETVAEVGNAAGEAKAAALLCEARTDFADTCHDVVVAVLEMAVARQPVLGEVSCNVTDALQKDALRKACKGCDPTPDAEIIARATIETLAFWGSCNAGGPLLRARGIQVPLDKQMEKDMDNRGKKGQKGKHAT
ncbi:unnamed protein product [Closterium sp. NIES-64]|nr:unnamed protein product [Closterium sp. NIES-64]